MAFSPSINDRLIKLISLMSKDGKVQDVEAAYGQKWSDVKTENEVLNSIFDQVDDGNNIIEAKELNLLNKIFLSLHSLIFPSSCNGRENTILFLSDLCC